MSRTTKYKTVITFIDRSYSGYQYFIYSGGLQAAKKAFKDCCSIFAKIKGIETTKVDYLNEYGITYFERD